MNPIKVAIADDEPFVRAALREYLSISPDFHVVGEAEDGDDALRLLQHTATDVLLLDLSMPRVSGLDVLRQIHRLSTPVGVVVLSAYPREAMALDEAWSAAGAYLDKAAAPEQILRTVREVALAVQPRRTP
jgi:two-component system, NarL family, invasion response regulator UvrY